MCTWGISHECMENQMLSPCAVITITTPVRGRYVLPFPLQSTALKGGHQRRGGHSTGGNPV
jgi:hypothetical protein